MAHKDENHVWVYCFISSAEHLSALGDLMITRALVV